MQVFVEAVANEILAQAEFPRFPADARTANDSNFRLFTL